VLFSQSFNSDIRFPSWTSYIEALSLNSLLP